MSCPSFRALAATLVLPLLCAGLGPIAFTACSGPVEITPPPETPADRARRERLEAQGITPGFSLSALFGGGGESAAGVQMAINPQLWRAALEILDFAPLDSVDSVGGVIITEWTELADAPSEEMKVVARITGRELAVSNLRVRVYRRLRADDGTTQAATVAADTETALEDRIFTRARALLVAQ